MPKEVRCILFDQKDCYVALSQFLSGRGRSVQPNEIERIEFSQTAGGPSARLAFQVGSGHESLVLPAPELLSAALLFCSARRIPLPNLGTKTLEISGANLILVIMTSLPSPKSAPKRLQAVDDDSGRRIALGLIATGVVSG